MRKLIIGQFSEAFPPLMDGVGSVAKNYTELLRSQGHDVYAVVSGSSVEKGYEYDREHGIDYTIRSSMFPLPGISPYGLVVKNGEFRKQVRAIKFDIIHTHTPFFFARFAEQKVRTRNIPLVTTFHTLYKDDLLGYTHSKTIAEHFIRIILHHYQVADEVWTPTEWSKKRLLEYGFSGEITVIPNGCDFRIPSAKEYEDYREEGRQIVAISDATPLLLYIGQIKKEKNLELTLEALLIAHQQGADFKMVFVGSGSDMPQFKSFVKEHNLESKIMFLGKITDREKIKALLAASTLFLFPSQYDTSALVMREAAAFSLPLLNTKGSSTAAASVEGESSFIAENTSASYAERLLFLLKHPALCKEVGLGAKNTLYLHWDDVMQKVIQRYENLVCQGRKPKNLSL